MSEQKQELGLDFETTRSLLTVAKEVNPKETSKAVRAIPSKKYPGRVDIYVGLTRVGCASKALAEDLTKSGKFNGLPVATNGITEVPDANGEATLKAFVCVHYAGNIADAIASVVLED